MKRLIFRRPGSDLLSHTLRCSTIGAEGSSRPSSGWDRVCPPRHSHQVVQTRRINRPTLPSLTARRQGKVFCVRSVSGNQAVAAWCLPLRVKAQRRTGPPGPEGPSAWRAGVIKPIERLVPVSFTCCHASTPGLSTWWSSTALKRDLVLRGASRLDAFSGYPVRT